MSLYTLALFAHLVGVAGVFAGIGVWLVSLGQMRRAGSVEQVRILGRLVVVSGRIVVGGVLVLAVAGAYMASTLWGWKTAWIDVATVSVVLIGVLGAIAIDPRVQAIVKAAEQAPEGELPAPLAALARDPITGMGLRVYITGLLGIVYLMTVKPEIGGAIVAMLVAAALGLAWSIPLWRATQTRTAVGADVAPRHDAGVE